MSNDTSTEAAAEVQPVAMNGFAVLQVISWTSREIARCREKLEVEPSGRVVAYLQGKIPGCKFAIKKIKEIFGFDDEMFDKLEQPADMSKLSHEQILGAEIDMKKLVEENELWTKFLGAVEERTEELKDFLLKSAKKSRQLDEYQGEYQGMMTYEKVFETIADQARFWNHSLFKKGDDGAGTRDANDQEPSLPPPGLPSPEDLNEPPEEDYDDQEERDEDDLQEEDNSEEDDPDVGMESGEDE